MNKDTTSGQSPEHSTPLHTPRPWKINGYRPFGLISRDPRESTYKLGDDKFTPFVHFSGTIENQRANAELIVKAVNSHEALLSALRYVAENHHEGEGMFDDIVNRAIDEATK